MAIRSLCLAPLAALALAACSTPYSQLVGERYHRAPIDTHPVIVLAVEGKHSLDRVVQVDPGVHQVTVQAPATPADRFGAQQTVSMEIKPCTRYYLVAQRDNALLRPFDVKVDREEPVPGCARPGEYLRSQ